MGDGGGVVVVSAGHTYVSPYRYLLHTVYLFMADFTNPDLCVCVCVCELSDMDLSRHHPLL